MRTPSMTSQQARSASPSSPVDGTIPASEKRPRLWPPALVLGMFWIVYSMISWSKLGVSLGVTGFLVVFGAGALTTLLFGIWWLAASRIGWRERLGIFGLAILVGVGVAILADKSALVFMLMPGFPLVLTAWTGGLLVSRNWRPQRRGVALAGVLCLTWSAFLTVRIQGVGGDFQPSLHWRWTLTPEQEYLLELDRTGEPRLPVGERHELTL